MAEQAKNKNRPKPKPAIVAPAESAVKAPGAKLKTKGRRGRKKERTQISVRIDTTVMTLACRQIEGTGMRMTDFIERGMLLAARELGDLGNSAYRPARLVLHDEGVEFCRLVMNINAIRRLPEVRKLSLTENMVRSLLLEAVKEATSWPGFDEAMSLMGTPQWAAEAKQA
jgi:hypothetical protein